MSWEDLAVKLLEKRNLTRDRQPRFMGGNTPIVVMEILRYRDSQQTTRLFCTTCFWCRKGGPSRARNWTAVWHSEMSWGDTCWQSKRFYWEGHPGGGQECEGTQNCTAPWLEVLWWWDEFPGGPWPVILIQNLSWWRTHRSAKLDASERASGKWTDRRCPLSTFPELFRLVVAC